MGRPRPEGVHMKEFTFQQKGSLILAAMGKRTWVVLSSRYPSLVTQSTLRTTLGYPKI
jgi:hypothetical protein